MGAILRRPLAVLLPIQAVLLWVRLDLLPVWGDEQFTLSVIALPWTEIPARLAADIHPPLYYALVKLWAQALAAWPVPTLVAARSFSGVWILLAGVVVDRRWLKELPNSARIFFWLLWVTAPVLLLYGRMARSYSLQLFLAVVALAAAHGLRREPNWIRAALFAAAASALLWTHYLPGLAITAAVLGLLLFQSWRHAAGAGALIALAYAPWLSVLAGALGRVSEREVYALSGSSWSEHLLRVAYTAVSFTAGEAHTLTSLALGAVVGCGLAYLAWTSLPEAPFSVATLAAATAVAYAGASSWVSFPFMPARLLFLFPFLLLLIASSRRRQAPVILAAAAALFVLADQHYFLRLGFLNKGYLIPFDRIAETIESGGPPGRTFVIADSANCDPSPLRAALPEEYEIWTAAEMPELALAEARIAESLPQTIWYLRTSRDVTPRRIHERFEETLRLQYSPTWTRYLRYSEIDRLALRLLGADPVPTHHIQLVRYAKE